MSIATDLVRVYAPKDWTISYAYCSKATHAYGGDVVVMRPNAYALGGVYFKRDQAQAISKDGIVGPAGIAYIGRDKDGRAYVVCSQQVLSLKEKNARSPKSKTARYVPDAGFPSAPMSGEPKPSKPKVAKVKIKAAPIVDAPTPEAPMGEPISDAATV